MLELLFLKILNIFSDSGHDMFSKEHKSSSLVTTHDHIKFRI